MYGTGAAGMVARAFRNVAKAIPRRGSRRHGSGHSEPVRVLERDLVSRRTWRGRFRQDRARRARSAALVFGLFVLLVGFGVLLLTLVTNGVPALN